MGNEFLLRSFMFVPAHNKRFIDKALECNADALILDMEDSTPSEFRSEARNNIIEYNSKKRFQGKKVFIRLNELNTKDFVEDISSLILDGITGYMLSKIELAEDIIFVDRLLSMLELKYNFEKGKFKLTPLIETTKAVLNVNEIAQASERLIALCFGGEDYLNDLGSIYTYQSGAFLFPQAMIVNAARSAGLLPINTPYLNISDIDGFLKEEKEAYKNGFAGCLVLNPKQINAANQAFSPELEQIEHSQRVMEAVKKVAGEKRSGVIMYEGTMVGPPMIKKASNVMRQQQLIEEKREV